MSHSVDPTEVSRELDRVADRASRVIAGAEGRRSFGVGLKKALPIVAAVPAFYVVMQLIRWNTGGEPYIFPLALVAVVALTAPFVLAWFDGRAASRRPVARSRAVGEADQQLALEGRLLAADEFVRQPFRTGFEEAAVADARERAAAAAAANFRVPPTPLELGRSATGWAAAGAVALGVAAWLGTFDPKPRTPRGGETTLAAAGGDPIAAEPDEEPTVEQDPPRDEPEVPERDRDDRKPAMADSKPSQAALEVDQEAKESAGKTGAGRSSGAQSSSAASESKSSPSSQGQESDPSDKPKAKPADKKKPKDTQAQPEPQEQPEDEQSGSTAGKGSSKGSNKNPTASDWKSRDQVTETDDQEIDEDDETDEDEEEQENRGGVQPSLRDRRPPVSRDLSIGFGNRPNPDANGRGGPSEQKKSRGVASLVLGVPIPDRIKGRPGPGPTKITQERIEPEAEETTPEAAAVRRARETPLERPTPMTLDPALRALVRDYFLRRRADA